MEIGKLLKEKFGFTEPSVRLKFVVRYSYSNSWLDSVLDDHFPELNHGHLEDISEFTGLYMGQLLALQTPRPAHGLGHPIAPPGKPWVSNPIVGTITINPDHLKGISAMTNKDLNKEFMGIVKTRIWRAWSNEERFCEQTNITKETFNRLLEGEIELTDFVTTTRLDQIFGGTPGYFKEVLVGLTAKYKERLESTSVVPEGFILVPVDLAKSIVSEASAGHDRNEFIDQLDKLIEERTR